jgi:glycosyltransferase involved in cell wall biosynthesis
VAKVKILHIIPTLEGGGAEKQLALLALAQAKQGDIVHIAIRRGGVYFPRLSGFMNIFIHKIGDYRWISPVIFIRLVLLIFKIKPNVIQTWLPQMDVLGGLVANLFHIPWVLSERTSGVPHVTQQYILNSIRAFLAKFSTTVVANSKSGYTYWDLKLSKSHRINLVPNAIDFLLPDDTVSYINSCRRNASLPYTFLVVGRLAKEKGVSDVLRAATLLPKIENVKIVIIGDGAIKDQLIDLSSELNLNSRVIFTPFDGSWLDRVNGATALISMSRYEGYPNVVLESVVSGLPIIVSDIAEHRDILSAKGAIFVPLDSPSVLANAMMNVIKDPVGSVERAHMALCEHRWLSPEDLAIKYKDIYLSITVGSQKCAE